MGLRTFTTLGELLWYYCSPVCGPPTQGVWDLILLWLYPLLPSHYGFSFVFGCDTSLVSSSILLLVVVQQQIAVSGLSQKMCTCLSTLPSWTNAPVITYIHHCPIPGTFKTFLPSFNFSLWGKHKHPHYRLKEEAQEPLREHVDWGHCRSGDSGSPAWITGPQDLPLLSAYEGSELGLPMSEVPKKGLVHGLKTFFKAFHPLMSTHFTGSMQIQSYFSGDWGKNEWQFTATGYGLTSFNMVIFSLEIFCCLATENFLTLRLWLLILMSHHCQIPHNGIVDEPMKKIWALIYS